MDYLRDIRTRGQATDIIRAKIEEAINLGLAEFGYLERVSAKSLAKQGIKDKAPQKPLLEPIKLVPGFGHVEVYSQSSSAINEPEYRRQKQAGQGSILLPL